MSEEEKAIDTLKEVASDDFDTLGDDISPKMAQNILNIIKKQQNEIEDLKETNEDNAEKSLLNDIFIKKNYISKNKIREKVKGYIRFESVKRIIRGGINAKRRI